MDKLKKLLTNKIVNCETQEESNQYLKIFGVDRHKYKWIRYKESTCYQIFGDKPVTSNIDTVLKRYSGIRIFKFSDLINKNLEVFLNDFNQYKDDISQELKECVEIISFYKEKNDNYIKMMAQRGKLKKLLTNKIVNCETFEESNQYLDIIDKSNSNCPWNEHKEKTCYRIIEERFLYSPIEYYKREFPYSNIYKFSDLIKKKD